jgi:hypothetical protein
VVFPTIRYVLQNGGVLLECTEKLFVGRYDGRGDVCKEFTKGGFRGAAVRGPHEKYGARREKDGVVVRVFESGYHSLQGLGAIRMKKRRARKRY